MKIVKTLLKIISYVITVILLIILALNVFTIVQRNVMKKDNPAVFGYSMSVVISGSMSPALEVNDAIIIKSEDDYKTGDIIMFREGNSFVAHRIAGERDGGYVTRGDANNTDDSALVKKEDIEGKVIFIIPHLGVFTGFLQSPLGMLCMLAAAVAMLELPRLFKRKK